MTKQELFEKYEVNESHNVWQGADSFYSIELHRLMHDGELPKEGDKSLKWFVELSEKIRDTKWFIQNVINKREDWGSLFLTQKRMIYLLADDILKEINGDN